MVCGWQFVVFIWEHHLDDGQHIESKLCGKEDWFCCGKMVVDAGRTLWIRVLPAPTPILLNNLDSMWPASSLYLPHLLEGSTSFFL
jgi:hypothetical protein